MSNYGKGWKEYGQRAGQRFKDTWSNWGNSMKNVATNIITGDYAGAANDYLKMVGEEFKRAGENAIDFFKTLFNHPDWYKYHGRLQIPTMNTSRPFDPRGVNKLNYSPNAGTNVINPGLGVGHIIQNNFVVDDFRDTQAWKLAIAEAFRINRMILKSNLPYTQQVFEDYLFRSIHVLMKAKQLERTLGWYYVAKGDIPELPEAMSRVTHNYFEQGVLNYSDIQILKPENLTKALTQFDKLRSILIQLSVPVKLAEYVSYYAGSVFVDQAAPNPNIYMNMIRDIPVYKTRDDGTVYVDGKWDIETGSIDTLIDEAIDLLAKYGVVAADIAKIGLFGQILLQDVTTYKPVVLQDATFFTLMINNYTCSKDELATKGLIDSTKDEFIRVDFLDEIGPENTVGVMNALVTFCRAKSIFRFVSQALYLDSMDSDLVPNFRGQGMVASNSTITGRLADVVGTSGYFIQFSSLVDINHIVENISTSTYETVSVTANDRLLSTITATGLYYSGKEGVNYTNGSIFIAFPTHTPTLLNQADSTYHNMYLRVVVQNAAGTQGIAIGIRDGGTGCFVVVNLNNGMVVSSAQYIDFGSTDLVQLQIQVDSYGEPYFECTGTNPYLICSSAMRAIAIPYLKQANPAYAWNFNDKFLVTYANLANSIKFEITDASLLSLFCEQVDYHIPFVATEVFKVDGIEYVSTSKLLKETYIPVLLNNIDIENILYWMYLGLFSVYDASRNMDDPHINKGNARRRKQRASDKKPKDEEK